MNNKENIKELLDYFHTIEEGTLQFDEEALAETYERNSHNNQSLAIKILSIFGGILASLSFLGFLFISNLYNSEAVLLTIGAACLAGAIWINREYNKILIDTVSVSAFIIGFILVGFGLSQLKINENMLFAIFIVIAFSSLLIVQNYMLSFIAVLIINGSILNLIMSNNRHDLVPVYVSALALLVTYFFLNEAKIITAGKALSKLYNPIRIGLIFSFLAGLILLSKKGTMFVTTDYSRLSSFIIISAIVYLIFLLLDMFNITEALHKVSIYIFSILLLLPTVSSPAVSGAVLLILLSFFVNYKTGLALGIIEFICFISLYYYDLDFILLTKSIILFSSGILFIALWFFLFFNKKLSTNEKV